MAPATESVKAVFLAALDKATVAERAAFLNEACAADATLRERVEALLRAHEETDGLLDRPVEDLLGLERDQAIRPEDTLKFLSPSQKPGSLGRLGHYEVLEVVGLGAMGIVVRAFDEKLHRVVAIKALSPQLAATRSAWQRFVREARAAAAVTHDNIIDIHAVEDVGEVPYIVMQFIDGPTLQQKLDRAGRMPLTEILRIAMQTAEGLAAAHRQGLVHRDVKPANILLENGIERVKITDFGLARASDDASLTQTGVVAGTPMYMSPEQAQGDPVDCRSDLFSLGSVLYTMCTGQPPFRGASAVAVLKRVCDEMPRPIGEINPELPVWLGEMVARLHSKDPAGRFASAREVADTMARHLAELQNVDGPSSHATLPATLPGGKRFNPTLRRLQPLAAVGLLALFGGLVLSEVTGVTDIRARVVRLFSGEATLRVEATEPSLTVPLPATSSPDQRDQWGGQAATARPHYSLGNAWPVPAPEELAKRPAAADALKREAVPAELLKKAGAGDPLRAPPELVAILGQDQHEGHLDKSCQLYALAISPDGKTLASGGLDGVVRLWDLATGQLRLELKRHQLAGVETVYTVAFNPAGTLLACGDRGGTIKLWDMATGHERATLVAPGGDLYQIAFSRDGRFLAAGRQSGIVQLWDVQRASVHSTLPGSNEAWCIAFSPDGQTLASGEKQSIHLWDVASGTKLGSLPEQSTTARWISFHPDGRLLATAAMHDQYDLSVRVWDLATLREKQHLDGHTSPVLTGAWRADGQLLATAGCTDGTVRLWDMTADPPRHKVLRVVRPNVPWLHAITLSPEGRHLAVGNPDGTIYILRLAQPGEVFRVR